MMDYGAVIYVAISCLLLPFFEWRQEYDGRAYPFIGLSALYAIYLLLGGYSLPYDNLTIATITLGLWLIASLIWTQHPHSVHELLNWLSYLMLFSAARVLPIEIVLWCVFPVPVIFAVMQLYKQAFKINQPFFIFGNVSHNSAFMLSGLLAGLYLHSLIPQSSPLSPQSFPLSPLLILSSIIGLAIITTKSKGSIIALLGTLLFMGVMLKSIFILSFMGTAVGLICLWLFKNRGHNWGVSGSLRERVLIFGAAWEILKEQPLFGHGLGMFKKMMPFAVTALYKKKWFYKMIKARYPEYQNLPIFANKVHNDHIETIVELGLIGYGLFVYLFLQMSFNIFSIGFLIMAVVVSSVFFYFRNTHTAVPFWAVMGGAAGSSLSVLSPQSFPLSPQSSVLFSPLSPLLILKLTGLLIIFTVISHTFRKLAGLAYFTNAALSPDIGKKLEFTQKAIDCDPCNGDYLNYYAYNGFILKPQNSLFYTLRGLAVYDGSRQIWGLWNILSRLIFSMDKLKISEWAVNHALKAHPDYDEGKKMQNAIYTMRLLLSNKSEEARERWQHISQ